MSIGRDMKAIQAARSEEQVMSEKSFQERVKPWLLDCFGEQIANDAAERNHRFLEEALETVQACGCTQSEAHQLVNYVFTRALGDMNQEVGGVMVTLAALCLAQGLDMHAAGETELTRIWSKIDQIRAKQAAKPKHSPLPESPATVQPFHNTYQADEAEPANTLSWAIDLILEYEQRLIDLGDPEHLVRSEVQRTGIVRAKQVLGILRTLRNGTGWDGIIDAYHELRQQGYSHEAAKMNAPMQYGFWRSVENNKPQPTCPRCAELERERDEARSELKHHQEYHGAICLPDEVPESYAPVRAERDTLKARMKVLEEALREVKQLTDGLSAGVGAKCCYIANAALAGKVIRERQMPPGNSEKPL